MGGKKRVIGTFKASSKDKNHPHSHTPKTPENFETKEESGLKTTPVVHEEHHRIEHHMPPHKRTIIKKALKIEHDFPPGMRMLFLFSSIMLAVYIVMTSLFSFTIVFGMVLEGVFARLLNIMIIIMLSFMVFGFAKKKMWSYYLAHYVFIFVIANSLISMFFIKKSVAGLLTVFVTLSFFFILLMNFITLWYVRAKRNYFFHYYHESHMSKEDKTYIFSIVSLWMIFVLTSIVLGNAYYTNTVKKVDSLITTLSEMYPYDVEDYCLSNHEKDLCLLTAAIMYDKELNSNNFCREIDSTFHRYTCFKAIQGGLA